MPLLVPGLVEPQSKKEDKDPKQQAQKDKSTVQSATQTQTSGSTAEKKLDGRSAPGMEGMSDEAVKKFEEAMELEYQKREGGA